jgi:beta-N-acetylhexosaminidase
MARSDIHRCTISVLTMALGPVMLDLRGTELAPDERELLRHPQTGGVVLFARNYDNPAQLAALTGAIHALRSPPLLIAVDQEGGRIQRFRSGFTVLPACRVIGGRYDRDNRAGRELARQCGWLMAAELRAAGVDFSLAPVLDLDHGRSTVIGDRAFHRSPDAVAELARACAHGMRAAGMAAVGKHFPGHGAVAADSHHELPIDRRSFADIAGADLVPFERLAGELAGIMPAHVVYPDLDTQPAGFSRRWLHEVLRGRCGFRGTIFSDDLSMAGAHVIGGYAERAGAALEAGCDMILICNRQDAAAQLLNALPPAADPAVQARLIRMHGRGETSDFAALRGSAAWRNASAAIAALEPNPELDLGDDQTLV